MNMYNELTSFPFVQHLTEVELSDGLLNGSIPSAILVCCSDMGPELLKVCNSAETNLLTFQNFGHKTDGIAEQALYSQVHSVIVYGHTDCAFMRFLVKSDELGHVEKDLKDKWFHCESETAMALNSDRTKTWKQVIELRVLSELNKLLQNQDFLKRAENLEVVLHGWVYDDERGGLDVYEPKERRFVAVEQRIVLQS